MSKQVTLTRRRVLGILITIGLASAAVGAGTFAAFSDTEQSTDNAIQAGTLDLTVDGGDTAVQVINVSNAVPNTTYVGNGFDLRNNGSVDGTLNVSVGSISSSENGVIEPEQSADTDGVVELESAVTVNVSVGGSQVLSDTVDNLSAGQQIHEESLASGDVQEFNVTYSVADAGNEIQSDNLSVNFDFELSS